MKQERHQTHRYSLTNQLLFQSLNILGKKQILNTQLIFLFLRILARMTFANTSGCSRRTIIFLLVIYRLDSRTFWLFFLAKALPLWERGVKMDEGGKT